MRRADFIILELSRQLEIERSLNDIYQTKNIENIQRGAWRI